MIDFIEPTDARSAFKGLSYRKYHNVPIYLEWAPLGIIDKNKAAEMKKIKNKDGKNSKNGDNDDDKEDKNDGKNDKNDKSTKEKDSKKRKNEKEEIEKEDEDSYSTLFLKNLNFTTDEDGLKYHIENLNVQGLRTVSVTKKNKGDVIMSMGFGFAEFKSYEKAEIAMRILDGSVLDGHSLSVKPSEKRLSISNNSNKNGKNGNDKGNEKSKNMKNKDGVMKLIVRNLAFQATEYELKSLFSAFGTVKRVRIPKKMGGVHRGFAFVEFSTVQEASTAMSALINTHLYGRHLVIEYANDNDEDLDFLRKKAKADEGAIKMDKKRRRIDDVIEGEGSAGVGSDDM